MKNDEPLQTKDDCINRLVDRIIGACLLGLVVALIWRGMA